MSLTKKVLYGLKGLYISDIASDGGMGSPVLADAVKYTKAGTPVLTTAQGTKTNFDIEESDTPYFSLNAPGDTTLSFSLYGMDAQQLYRFFGGTIVTGATSADPDTWEAPDTFPTLEKSILMVFTQGGSLQIVRGSVVVTPQILAQKNALPQIDFVITVLQPTKTNTKRMKFTQADLTPLS